MNITLARIDDRLIHGVRQFRPCLTNDGGRFKTCNCNIHMFIQIHADTAPPVS